MGKYNIARAKAIEKKNKEKWLALNPTLTDESGIYVLTREDEQGIKYAYVGQAKHILTRLAQHLVGYQHIDLSLKKHGLGSKDNPHGWRVRSLKLPISELDEMAQSSIKAYADKGYQLRNTKAGGRGKGKAQIDEYRPQKGYRDGLLQGKKNLARELKHIADKHLEIRLREDKKNNKVSIKAFEKFKSLIDEDTY